MCPPSPSETRATLLRRLRIAPGDAAAWAEFVALYGPRIFVWARRWGLQPADADDLTQTVLLKLSVALQEFEYDPTRSFRAWLKIIAYHAWKDQAERIVRPGQGAGGNFVADILDQVEARRTLAECLEEAFDQDLLQEAMARVQLRVEPRTWEAFRLLAFEGWSGADAARHLGMRPATVFSARSKVQRMLHNEVARLESGEMG